MFPFPTFAFSSKVTISNTANAFDAVDRTTYTFTSQSFGVADANRKIVVGVFSSASTPNVTSVTIGGVGATLVKKQIDVNAGSELWQADVPTGASGIITVVNGSSQGAQGIGVWAVYGAASAAHDTGGNNTDPMVDTIDIPANGVCLGMGGASGGQNPTHVWTNLTEDFDNSGSGETNVSFSGASKAFDDAQTALSITMDQSATPTRSCFALASWGPE